MDQCIEHSAVLGQRGDNFSVDSPITAQNKCDREEADGRQDSGTDGSESTDV